MEIVEINKVPVVSMAAAACVFVTNAGAKEDKSGFYLAGRAGASVVSLSDRRFLSGDEEGTPKYKGGDGHDIVFGSGIAAGYDFYPQLSIPVRTELEFYVHGEADSKYSINGDSRSGGYWRDGLKNEVLVNAPMLNAYYGFRNNSAFTSRVFTGIDYARIHQRTTGISTWDYEYGGSGHESLLRSGPVDNLVWSLGMGVRYDVTPDTALDLNYRYLDTGSSSVSHKGKWGDKYKSEADVKSHDIMLDMIYNF